LEIRAYRIGKELLFAAFLVGKITNFYPVVKPLKNRLGKND